MDPTQDFDANAAAAADAGIFGLPHTAEQAAVVLVPVPFDATTSYHQGAANGPAAILAASHQVDLFDVALGSFYTRGLHQLPLPQEIVAENTRARLHAKAAREAADALGACQARESAALRARQAAEVARVNAAGEVVNAWVQAQVARQLAAGKVVGTVGGDHSTPFAAIAEHVRRYPNMSLLHVDAHADLRPAYEGFTWSHASIMHNVLLRTPLKKLVQVGLRDLCAPEYRCLKAGDIADAPPAFALPPGQRRIEAILEQELAEQALWGRPFMALAQKVTDKLGDEVYVSLDIDGLDPQFCPNTGTPVPGGLSFREVRALLCCIVQSGRRIVGFDLNEVAPGPAGNTWDANVGARLLFLLCGLTLQPAANKSAAPKAAAL